MKTLPIQKIQTRGEQDIFLKEGGGNNELPDWATKETILEHAGRMNAAFASVERLFDERDNDELPLLMVAYLDENATGRKSFRANVRAVFDNRDKRNVLGKESHRGLLVKVESKEDLRQMAQSVGSVQAGCASKDKTFGVAVVDDLQLFRPYMEEGIEGCDLKVRLVDYHDERLNAIADQMMLHYGEAQHVDVRKLNYADGLRLYSVKGADVGAVAALATMDAVISVRKMPYIELTVSPEEYNTQIEVKNPREDLWMLSLYLCGANSVDLLLHAPLDGNRYEGRRQKTGQRYDIIVTKEAAEIIERWKGKGYMLCPMDTNKSVKNFRRNWNDGLQNIGRDYRPHYGYRVKAEDAPFAGLTTYWARHTWATIAASLDIPKEVIARCLTHSWGQTVTDTYIDFDWKKVDDAVKKVVDYISEG